MSITQQAIVLAVFFRFSWHLAAHVRYNKNMREEGYIPARTQEDEEQRVFSDFQISPGEQKDFKQDAVKRRLDELSGADQKTRRRDLDDFSSYAEFAAAELTAHREQIMHSIYGYEVSETDIRKAATNILQNFDAFAERFELNGQDSDVVFEQILLLQQGTPEQQEKALRELHDYDPGLADAVLKAAKDERDLDMGRSLSHNYEFSTEYNLTASDPTAGADFTHRFEYR